MTQLQAGDKAPDFTLPNADGEPVSLRDFAGRKLVVYFYPAALTPGCTTQAIDFSTAHDDFEAAGYEVIGISPDDVVKLEKFTDSKDLKITLLSDPQREVIAAYDAWGERKLYGKPVTGVIRSTFVIAVNDDGVGTIESVKHNVRATGSVERLGRELGLTLNLPGKD